MSMKRLSFQAIGSRELETQFKGALSSFPENFVAAAAKQNNHTH